MRNIIFTAFFLFLFTSCSNENIGLDGQWIETRNPANVWEIQTLGSGIIGTRISGDDMYPFETETWTINREKGLIICKSKIEKDGSTLTYFPDKDKILRTPPGRMYKRK